MIYSDLEKIGEATVRVCEEKRSFERIWGQRTGKMKLGFGVEGL